MIPAANSTVGNVISTDAVKTTSMSATACPLGTSLPSMEGSTKDLGLTPMEVDQVLDSSLKDTELSTEEAALASSYLVEFGSGGGDGAGLEKSSMTTTTAMTNSEGKSSPSIEITLDSDGMLGGK